MGRKLVIVRHGERVDFTFGDSWLEKCFDSEGKYNKHNLNMPDEVVRRDGMPKSFRKDCPLTQVGLLQGNLVGKGLLQENVLANDFEVYVSPALRSIQTATAILEGMKLSDVVLKVEPCLFEWTGWYADGIPRWLSLAELMDSGYKIDTNYEPFMKNLTPNETCETYYNRTHELVTQLLRASDKDILLVAHGSTLDVGTRQLCGSPARSVEDFLRVLHNVPYAGVCISEKDDETQAWVLSKPGTISLRHSACSDFDAHKTFQSTC